ncbi:hypothetical protein H6G89_07270 [Oscillatoria sp. FACHB-1407]|uniref:hypothetical protein n=1 Tax=Oscillatoria sp. FACHB-1407 TaxID=2692847 RepID=UPI00168741FE|nr:hypothetical protein [Oscillatoria sp. FACHB-1407]MBD2460842.1 hypothetical protein [Oscillatoria sp. FACHB-1407]
MAIQTTAIAVATLDGAEASQEAFSASGFELLPCLKLSDQSYTRAKLTCVGHRTLIFRSSPVQTWL